MKKRTLCPNKASIYMKILQPTKKIETESIAEFTKRVENMIREEHFT